MRREHPILVFLESYLDPWLNSVSPWVFFFFSCFTYLLTAYFLASITSTIVVSYITVEWGSRLRRVIIVMEREALRWTVAWVRPLRTLSYILTRLIRQEWDPRLLLTSMGTKYLHNYAKINTSKMNPQMIYTAIYEDWVVGRSGLADHRVVPVVSDVDFDPLKNRKSMDKVENTVYLITKNKCLSNNLTYLL